MASHIILAPTSKKLYNDIRPGRLSHNRQIISIVIKICAFVISTGGPQSGLKWRDPAANEKQV